MIIDNSTVIKTFSGFYKKDGLKNAIIGASILLNLVTFLSLYTIIWYERFGADNKRILTNKLVSMIW